VKFGFIAAEKDRFPVPMLYQRLTQRVLCLASTASEPPRR
jgi:hypothetical protein